CDLVVHFFYELRHHRDLHSFPTRRSSDLREKMRRAPARSSLLLRRTIYERFARVRSQVSLPARHSPAGLSMRSPPAKAWSHAPRSEEHTSELQSLAYLVCRLLLEKKKNRN